ncbi:MAG: glycosyl transferase [Saprospiraceae bacterium]|nr:glycosyl transferase [Saprospiraceae bacterium]
MIPKIIHYCWFGGQPQSALMISCLRSWKEYLSDFQIIEWNETNCNFDIPYAKAAYAAKKWAFVADYTRLKVLHEMGGVYLDTDMLIVKPLDTFLSHRFFIGCEKSTVVSMGIIGCLPSHPLIQQFLTYYEQQVFDIQHPIVITRLMTDFLMAAGFVKCHSILTIQDLTIYPSNYFYPFPFPPYGTYHAHLKPETYAVHLWAGSWLSEWEYFKIGNPTAALIIVREQLRHQEHRNWGYRKKLILFLCCTPFWMIKAILRRLLQNFRQ